MGTQVEAAEWVREIRSSRNLLARMVNQPQESGDHEPSVGLKRYVSRKMRNMCESKTLQNKEGAQHAQIVETRKPYDSGKMINMCTFCCKNDEAGRRKSTAELRTVQALAHAEKNEDARELMRVLRLNSIAGAVRTLY